jgi:DNA-3-methyladenine glycosylase II
VTPQDFQHELRNAERHLTRVDARLGAVVEQAGPCALTRVGRFDPFAALLSSIAHQQLHGAAARSILARVKARFAAGRWPRAEVMATARLPAMKACGLSTAKALAIRDLARKRLQGIVPGATALHRLDDEAIVARLTQVRGVGRWTVEMLLMFRLGRLDVLPVDDYGVRNGFSRLMGAPELVKPKALLAAGEAWRPYRTVASWYLWRAAEA